MNIKEEISRELLSDGILKIMNFLLLFKNVTTNNQFINKLFFAEMNVDNAQGLYDAITERYLKLDNLKHYINRLSDSEIVELRGYVEAFINPTNSLCTEKLKHVLVSFQKN